MGLVRALAILTVFDSQVRKERQYEGFVGVDKFATLAESKSKTQQHFANR